jgi:uncharacterized membrane protein
MNRATKSAENGLKETARLEAFSDGVFAIAIIQEVKYFFLNFI